MNIMYSENRNPYFGIQSSKFVANYFIMNQTQNFIRIRQVYPESNCLEDLIKIYFQNLPTNYFTKIIKKVSSSDEVI